MTTTHQELNKRHVQQHTNLTSVDPTSILDPTRHGAYLTALHIVNDNASATTAAVTYNDASTSAPLWNSQTIAANSEVTLMLPAPFHLRDGDEVRIAAEHANRLHVWAFGTLNRQ